MLYAYQLSTSPSQQFDIDIGGYNYTFRIKMFRDVAYCDISIDGVKVSSSVRCVRNKWLIPYKYLAKNGNFRFESDSDAYIDTDNFNTDVILAYYTNEEIAALEE